MQQLRPEMMFNQIRLSDQNLKQLPSRFEIVLYPLITILTKTPKMQTDNYHWILLYPLSFQYHHHHCRILLYPFTFQEASKENLNQTKQKSGFKVNGVKSQHRQGCESSCNIVCRIFCNICMLNLLQYLHLRIAPVQVAFCNLSTEMHYRQEI